MTELERMERGLWYDANNDVELLAKRSEAESLCFTFNHTSSDDPAHDEALRTLIPQMEADAIVLAPFYADYGYNCTIGAGTFINHGAYLMDGAPISIGRNCFIGPSCGMYTAAHPLVAEDRNLGLEKASPISLGDNVWIGASVTILPGITIGDGAVIGAGSVVTRDNPRVSDRRGESLPSDPSHLRA